MITDDEVLTRSQRKNTHFAVIADDEVLTRSLTLTHSLPYRTWAPKIGCREVKAIQSSSRGTQYEKCQTEKGDLSWTLQIIQMTENNTTYLMRDVVVV